MKRSRHNSVSRWWIGALVVLSGAGRVSGQHPTVTIPAWPTKSHTPSGVPLKAIEAESLRPRGKMRKVELPDTLDLARLDVPEREAERDFGWRKYKLQFKGNTLADIRPRTKDAALIPLFPPERTRGDKAETRKVERFEASATVFRRDR
jgi:hypothetical protein